MKIYTSISIFSLSSHKYCLDLQSNKSNFSIKKNINRDCSNVNNNFFSNTGVQSKLYTPNQKYNWEGGGEGVMLMQCSIPPPLIDFTHLCHIYFFFNILSVAITDT